MGSSAVVVVLAAGRGSRFGSDGNKVYAPIAGVPLLAWTLHGVNGCAGVLGIILVVRESEAAHAASLARRVGVCCDLVRGGETRADSVRAGLAAAAVSGAEYVAVHDGARPFVTPELVARTLRSAGESGATGAAMPLTDTVKAVGEGGTVERTLERGRLRAMQTPQTFRLELLVDAYARAGADANEMTDDCEVAERAGYRVVLCPGDPANIKVTHPLDLALAEAIARLRERPPYG